MGRWKYTLLHGVLKFGGLVFAFYLAVDYLWFDPGEVDWFVACMVSLMTGCSAGYQQWKQAEQRYWRHRRTDDRDGGNGATQNAE